MNPVLLFLVKNIALPCLLIVNVYILIQFMTSEKSLNNDNINDKLEGEGNVNFIFTWLKNFK